MSLDFAQTYYPTTATRIAHTYPNTLNHVDSCAHSSVGKKLWSRTVASCRGTLPRGKYFSKKNLALIGAFCHADKKHRAAITRAADKSLVKCICECVLNILHGVVKLSASEKRRLSKHKHALRKLSHSSGNDDWRTKKRVIIQNGGSFLPILLASLVSTLISKIIGSSDTR